MKIGTIIGALLGGLIWPVTAAVHITTPGSSTREVVLAGVADGKAATYKNSIWISADVDVPSLAVVPSELKGPGGPIPMSSIHVAPITLQKNVPKELAISVDTALVQGDFTGTLVLSVPDLSPIDPVQLKLRLTPKTNVVAAPAAFAFKATRCGTAFTCGFVDFLLPGELAGASRPWKLVNQTPATVDWTSSTLTLHGDKTGDFIDVDVKTWSAGKPIALKLPLTLPKQTPTDATFNFDRGAIQADHYQGQYRAELQGGDPITVPFALDVRDGPILPLIVLILGIVLGRLIQSTNTPRAQAQIRLLDKFNLVSVAVDNVGTAEVKRALQLRLSETLVDIRKMSQGETDISNQLDLILRLAADSDKLDLVEPLIQAVADATVKAQLTKLLADARVALTRADPVTAEKNLADIDSGLSPAPAPLPPGALPPAPPVPAAPPEPTVPAPPAKPNFVLKSISFLSGAEPIDGDFFVHYGRPLMFLLLLILLAFVGLYNSYIKNATFGVEGYFDYLSLFLWGISADVAQKTLQNLSLSRSS
jgi:hypothetical protein